MTLKDISEFFKQHGYRKSGNYFLKDVDDDWGFCFTYSKRANEPFSFAYGVFCRSYSNAMNKALGLGNQGDLVVFTKPIFKMDEYGKVLDEGVELVAALNVKIAELENHGLEYIKQIHQALSEGSIPPFLYIKRVCSDDDVAYKYRALIFKLAKGQLVSIDDIDAIRNYIKDSKTPNSAYLYNLLKLEEYLNQ